MIGEFLFRLPLRGKGRFLWLVELCAIMQNLWGERNNSMFRGLDKQSSDVWALIRFHVSTSIFFFG